MLPSSATTQPKRVVLCASRFNEAVTSRLVEGARDALAADGFPRDVQDVVWVAGAWELPLAVQQGLGTGKYALAVVLGAIVRGETPHFDVLAAEVTRGLGQVALEQGRPVGFGVLTCDTLEQALARAGGTHGNKGAEAASAALQSLRVLSQLG
jgi:6,7-dimethyl-8-ribityllumazine synthase